MGGHGSGRRQASAAESRVLEGQLDATAYLVRAIEANQREREYLDEALGRIRRANGLCVRAFYFRDSLGDLEAVTA